MNAPGMSQRALMTLCPDENALAEFARGQGSVAVETHLDGCETCRRSVAAAASEHTLPTMPPGLDLTPGQRVGRYEIERELGRGGMGVVYMARDLTLDRHVALKLLHARRDEAAQARLLREAQVMAKLAHQNVVPVFELGDWRGDLYLVMELVGGVTLETWLKASKHSTKEILAHFIQAGRGLAAAHAAGVVHRDFKPANVLVGLDGRVRVTDFGLSRPGAGPTLMELPPMASPLVTREGTLVGTLVYMSPEQLDGKPATDQSDQFSFCVSLAEALSGVRPFDGQSWSELAVSQANKPVLARSIPQGVRKVLRKGLQLNANQRFTSMTTMLNALERIEIVGWKEVGIVSLLAVTSIAGLVVLGQPTQRSHGPDSPLPAVANTKRVLMASRDLAEGTVLTFDMMAQRNMPEEYVTESFINPDLVQYAIGQPVNSAIKAGDSLLWSQIETKPDPTLQPLSNDNVEGAAWERCKPIIRTAQPGTIVVAWKVAADGHVIDAHTEPSPYDATELPSCLVTFANGLRYSARPSESRLLRMPITISGERDDDALSPLQSESVDRAANDGFGDMFTVIATGKHRFTACVDAFKAKHPTTTGRIVIRWKNTPSGEPSEVRATEVASEGGALADPDLPGCLISAFRTFRFPPGSSQTSEMSFPIKF